MSARSSIKHQHQHLHKFPLEAASTTNTRTSKMPAQHRTEPPPHNPAFSLSQVTVADGPALAANNIPAFWADPHWRLEWRHRALDYHTSQVALRYPRTLLRNLATARHQKAVDAVTGEIQEEILARKVYMSTTSFSSPFPFLPWRNRILTRERRARIPRRSPKPSAARCRHRPRPQRDAAG